MDCGRRFGAVSDGSRLFSIPAFRTDLAGSVSGLGALALAVSVLGWPGTALASDPFEIKPIDMWSGPYLGAHVGVGASRGSAYDSTFDQVFSTTGGDMTLRDIVFSGGAQAGVNVQKGNVIYGLEGDISWTDFDQDKIVSPGPNNLTAYTRAKMDWLATLRARLGVTAGNAMFYVTGGLAFAEVQHCANRISSTSCSNSSPTDFAFSDVRLGLAAGAGVEARLNGRWSVKGEYLYVNMGERRMNGIAFGGLTDGTQYEHVKFSQDTHLLRIGVNYHLNARPLGASHDNRAWNGLYAGVHLGTGAFSGRAMDWDGWGTPSIFEWVTGDVDLNAFAAIGGGQAGVNVRTENAVFGLEADFSLTGYSEGRGFNHVDNLAVLGADYSAHMDWLATFRGRLGVAAGNAMAYVTGGLALAHMDYSAINRDTPSATASFVGIQPGLAAGTGVEARITDKLSVKAEYLYVGLNEQNQVYNQAAGSNMDFSADIHMLRGGVNYHFGGLPLDTEPEPGIWHGFYAGLHGGAGHFTGRTMDWDANLALDPSGDFELTEFAALAGAQVGVNFQSGNVVFGLETDLSWTDFKKESYAGFGTYNTNTGLANGDEDRNYYHAQMNWLATVRGRLGLANDTAMAYVTGGLALADVKQCANALWEHNAPGLGPAGRGLVNRCAETNSGHDGSHMTFDDVTWGVVMGAGAEVRITENLSLKGEYLFGQFAENNQIYANPNPGFSGLGMGEDGSFFNHVHVARIGLNYQFMGL